MQIQTVQRDEDEAKGYITGNIGLKGGCVGGGTEFSSQVSFSASFFPSGELNEALYQFFLFLNEIEDEQKLQNPSVRRCYNPINLASFHSLEICGVLRRSVLVTLDLLQLATYLHRCLFENPQLFAKVACITQDSKLMALVPIIITMNVGEVKSVICVISLENSNEKCNIQ
ncbi:hypothetical protein J6590_073414 [Homalodisca vitripennis]|nr:hypothetical protein J6590_073414 [Homalodisca vitripennis]